MRESKYEERKLADLKPHPLQSTYYNGLDQHQLQALADDIESNGLREPPEILAGNKARLPANTIISGHQRVEALKLLGYEVVEAHVRYDLAGATAAEIERYFLDSNQNRQHLSKLQQARIACRLYAIEQDRDLKKLAEWEQRAARDRAGQQIGMTGRNLQRYWRVLQAPLAVQQAFDAGELPLVTAGRVAGLEDEVQEEIAVRIGAGEDARDVVAEYLAKSDSGVVDGKLLRQLGRVIDDANTQIVTRLDDVSYVMSDAHVHALSVFAQSLPELIDRLRKNQERQKQIVASMQEELDIWT